VTLVYVLRKGKEGVNGVANRFRKNREPQKKTGSLGRKRWIVSDYLIAGEKKRVMVTTACRCGS